MPSTHSWGMWEVLSLQHGGRQNCTSSSCPPTQLPETLACTRCACCVQQLLRSCSYSPMRAGHFAAPLHSLVPFIPHCSRVCFGGKVYLCPTGCLCTGKWPCRMPTKSPSCKSMPNYTCVDNKHFCLGEIGWQAAVPGTLGLQHRMPGAAANVLCRWVVAAATLWPVTASVRSAFAMLLAGHMHLPASEVLRLSASPPALCAGHQKMRCADGTWCQTVGWANTVQSAVSSLPAPGQQTQR